MKKNSLAQRLNHGVLVFDGGFGTELYRRNFFVNTSYDNLVLTAPATVTAIHQAYVDAGAEVITTNTYSANKISLARFGLAEKVSDINFAAVALAKKAAAGKPEILIAGSIGPVPADSDRKLRIEALSGQAQLLIDGGADFLIFESISNVIDLQDISEAVKSIDAEWMPSFVMDADARLADDTPVEKVLQMLENSTPAAFGINCGTGPETTFETVQKIVSMLNLPLVVQPGAGVPKNVDNRFMPMTTPEYFTTYALRYVNLGAKGVGGCCGISPEHISDMVRSLKPMTKMENSEALKVEIKETDLLDPIPTAEKSSFGAKLVSGKFLKLIELTPPQGFDLTDTIAKARLCKDAGFDAINLPDGPRASCRISQVITAAEIQEKAGIETIIHCCGRDRNLISLQSMILGCMAKQISNILFITGDPPKLGNYPFSSGVFDVDSIGLVKLQSRLNRGIDAGGHALGKGVKTAIVSGVGADPNAIDPEREYRRLAEKIDAGAEFIITQPVFDPDALLKFLKKTEHFKVPVIAGVWPFASYRNALFMKTEVPGVVVPDWIMEAMKKADSKEAQRAEGIRIARMLLSEIRDAVRGVATSAPFGNVNTAINVCEGF
ncbi:MAG: bifunctional homocysteine S-methyltransferase/methylenetetrahydrofolate reductase [Lentisphaerae bacterium]|nr:bifunctional homocysteine S-methyltransferase/methylenetetrahydrofolate reductase [Lentisphaerota bacterium]